MLWLLVINQSLLYNKPLNCKSSSPNGLKYFSTSSSVTCCSVGGSHLGLLSLSTSTKTLEYNAGKQCNVNFI